MTLGTLYVCGTPIGNLADLSERALATLRSCDLIAAEDTRQIAKICARHGIATPTISHHAHNEARESAKLVARLQEGAQVALVSDAGMPGISDPGETLIHQALAAGIPVVPIPGPVAAVTALVVSGLATDRWAFEGFLPREGKLRRRRLKELAEERRTVIFYEGPHRLLDTLVDMAALFGPGRRVAVARELTKLHEEVWRGTLEGAIAHYQATAPRGEITVVLEGAPAPALAPPPNVDGRLRELLGQGVSTQDASRTIAREYGIGRRDVYQRALELEEDA